MSSLGRSELERVKVNCEAWLRGEVEPFCPSCRDYGMAGGCPECGVYQDSAARHWKYVVGAHPKVILELVEHALRCPRVQPLGQRMEDG